MDVRGVRRGRNAQQGGRVIKNVKGVPTYTFVQLHDFSAADGQAPGSLVQDKAGALYGATSLGNTIFKLDPVTKATNRTIPILGHRRRNPRDRLDLRQLRDALW